MRVFKIIFKLGLEFTTVGEFVTLSELCFRSFIKLETYLEMLVVVFL